MEFIFRKYILIFIAIPIVAFFSPIFLGGLLPMPSDTIVGLYHPFRDLYRSDIPFKNFLITDPVRQLYPWKYLVIENLRNFNLPLWNPYEMAGKPLLANFQSSVFYPLNLVLFINPFFIGWTILIILQPILAALFLYLYLRILNIDNRAITLGTLAFIFSGFFVSWLEWGNVGHTALWLPLILLSVDKIFYWFKDAEKSKIKDKQSLGSKDPQNAKIQFKIQKYSVWLTIFMLSLTSSLFAGHLQIFFYVFVFSATYFFARWIQFGRSIKILFQFIIYYLLFIIITSIQWIPTLQFILLSARGVDQSMIDNPGWFLPWQHLIQFLAPDFFGNPTTLNYWGVWNYAELVGYIGIVPLIFALLAMFCRFDKKTLFFGSMFFVSLLFALPNPISILPFSLNIPFLSMAQPTRLLFISCFSLSILAAFGFDYFLKSKRNEYAYIIILSSIALILAGLWSFTFLSSFNPSDLAVSKNNLKLPTLIVIVFGVYLTIYKVNIFTNIKKYLPYVFLIIASFELVRFAIKFEPFTQKEYLFPSTKIIDFLQKQKGPFRIASTDRRILPPNFSTYYRIQSIEGYDPLYLQSYAEFIAASERGKPDISPPFGFNRIITPHNVEPKFIDLLNVKYILSLSEINSAKFREVFQEGETIVYENINTYPRAFFVEKVIWEHDKQLHIERLFNEDLRKVALIESCPMNYIDIGIGEVSIVEYADNKIVLKTKNDKDGYLVLTDVYYPSWRATIDGKDYPICKTDYTFRGIFVPKGEHNIIMFPVMFDGFLKYI